MSGQPLWLRDLIAYSIQIGALVGVGAFLATVPRLRVPKVRLAYWHALLAICIFLPALQPWRPEVLQTPGMLPSAAALATAVMPARSGIPLGPAATAAPASIPWAGIIFFLICAGIVIRVLWMGLGLTRLWMYRRRAQRLQELSPVIAEAQRLASVSPSIFISDKIQVPVTFGFFRPAILFPERFLEMDPSAQTAVALHELLHVERRDWLWNLVEELILTFLWFEAPLWWTVRCVRLSREQVVDAEAIRRSNARGPYLRALLEMAGQKPLAEYLPASLFLRENQLAERVALMMKEVHMSRPRLIAFVVTTSAVLLIAGASLAYAFPLKVAVRQTNSPDGQAASAIAPRMAQLQEQARATQGEASPVASQPAQTPQPAPESRPAPQPLKSGAAQVNPAEIQRKIQQAMQKAQAAQAHQEEIQKKVEDAMKKAEAAGPAASPALRKLEQALEKAKAAQQATSRIDEAQIQQRVDAALKRAQIDQKIAAKIDQAQIQRQIDLAMKRAGHSTQGIAAGIASAEVQHQVEQAISQAVAEAMQQVTSNVAAQVQQKVNKAAQKSAEEAMDQAAAARHDASGKIDRAEIQREMARAQKELQAARKEADRAREILRRDRMELRQQLRKARPTPSPSPKPPVPSSKDLAPPPPPPPPPPLPSHSPVPQAKPSHL